MGGRHRARSDTGCLHQTVLNRLRASGQRVHRVPAHLIRDIRARPVSQIPPGPQLDRVAQEHHDRGAPRVTRQIANGPSTSIPAAADRLGRFAVMPGAGGVGPQADTAHRAATPRLGSGLAIAVWC